MRNTHAKGAIGKAETLRAVKFSDFHTLFTATEIRRLQRKVIKEMSKVLPWLSGPIRCLANDLLNF